MKLRDIARVLNCSIADEAGEIEISGIASLEEADTHTITFLSNNKFLDTARTCKATVIIVQEGTAIEGKISLAVADPYLGYAKVAQLFEEREPLFEGPVHPAAIIDTTATIDPTVFIGPGTVIGKSCVIKEHTIIGAHCVIENETEIGAHSRIDSGVIIRRNSLVGNRVIIQSGTVIGSEGFGNAMENGTFVRIPCFGTVIIEDDVEIGANVTVDRGSFAPTIIRKGARIDNLVQIAHNVEVGEHSAIAGQTGISGSTKLEKGVILAGQVGLAGHLTIGERAFVGAKAGVSKNVEPGQKVTGYPARDLMKTRRVEAAQLRLPEMVKEIKRLRKELDQLKNNNNDS